MNGWGALIGLAYGAGGASIALYDGPWRALRFRRRVHTALHDETLSRRIVRQPLQILGAARRHRIEIRQLQAGLPPDAAAHVLSCALGAIVGIGISAAVLVALTGLHQVRQPAAVLLLLVLAAVSGWLVADAALTRRVRSRQQQATVSLPAMIEAIALAVSAGASVPTALDIVSRRIDSVLTRGLRRAIDSIQRGATLDDALGELLVEFPFASMSRFVSAVLIAMERGTPVVEVLHAQAADARQESRRLLLESAGRREVGMLVPVIFFVLPAVVVVALFPGFRELSSIAT